nr:hypothetical protein Q903MT_gene3152 [Picea sitchensis]
MLSLDRGENLLYYLPYEHALFLAFPVVPASKMEGMASYPY